MSTLCSTALVALLQGHINNWKPNKRLMFDIWASFMYDTKLLNFRRTCFNHLFILGETIAKSANANGKTFFLCIHYLTSFSLWGNVGILLYDGLF